MTLAWFLGTLSIPIPAASNKKGGKKKPTIPPPPFKQLWSIFAFYCSCLSSLPLHNAKGLINRKI